MAPAAAAEGAREPTVLDAPNSAVDDEDRQL
jgi:hypothetical protein